MPKNKFCNKFAISFSIIFCLAQLSVSWALAGTGEPVELEPTYVTTATRSEKKVEGVSASVTVITAVEIAAMGAVNLKDIMKKPRA
jgi:outer membrane receptor for ferrienterochelin and colicins